MLERCYTCWARFVRPDRVPDWLSGSNTCLRCHTPDERRSLLDVAGRIARISRSR